TVYIGRRLLYSKESSAGYSPFYENATLRSVHYGNREVAIYPKEYMNCTNLQNVLIGSGINIIDDEAFQNCTSLPTILIPNTVDKPLGASSFKNCSSLRQAVIGDSVPSIGQSAFESCVSLVDVKVGARVSDIYASAFKNCSSLPQITIPQATNSIKDYVFDDCAKLKYFFLEDGPNAISLGKNAATASTNVIGSECPLFYDCALDSIYLGRNLSYSLKLEDGYSPFYFNKTLRAVVIGDQATSVHENEFYKCQKLKYVSVGNGVTAIGNWAFSGCISLDHFLFGEGLETIGKEAFSDCTAVTKIVGNRPVPPVCGEQALVDINVFNCTLYVPTASVSAYQAAEQWKDFFFVEGAEKTYTLQYVIDGEVYATYNLVEGAAIEQPAAPTRDGYTFSGWSEIPATMPAGDVTITGSFTLVTYALNFVVDGEVYTTTAMAAGSAIELPAAPAKDGYEFIGWAKADAVVNASNADAVLYTNAPCTNTVYGDQFTSWNVLFDGQASTFFHSEYAEKESADGLDHYLRVDMGEGNSVTYFTFTYTNRNTNSTYYAPKVIVVEGSNSANGEYEEIVTLSGLSNVDSFVYNSPKIGNGTAYRYIRYRVTETQYNTKVYNHPYFHIGEFGMTDVELPTTMPAKDVTLVALYEAKTSFPVYYNTADGLPGADNGSNLVWTSPVMYLDGSNNGIRITVFENNNEDYYNTYAMVALGEMELYDRMGNKIEYTAANVTSNSVQYGEGLEYLCDGDYATYYHSAWNDWNSGSVYPTSDVYWDIQLPQAINSVYVKLVSRDNKRLMPAYIGITEAGTDCDVPALDTSCGEAASYSFADGVLTISGTGEVTSNKWKRYQNLITSVVIDEGITAIPYNAFLSCASLTSASIPTTLTAISEGAFSRTGLTSVTIPEGVTTIPAWAFDNCPALATVSLPSTLASIDNYAFENCAALTSITVANATPATLGESVFNGIGSDATLYVPAGSKAAYEAYENWSVIPNIVELVNKYQITYIVDGEVYATEEIVEGSRITPIDAPEKELYEFVEWTGLPTTMPAENIEVVASYKQVAVSITINKYGSATYASPYALDFSEVSGLTAYAATGYNTYTGIITMTKLNTAHEGVGLFLNGTPNTTYVVPIMEDTGDNTLNLMVGVLAKTTVNQTTDDGLYVNFKYTVASGSTTPMFYRYSNGSSVSAGKAYLQLPQSWLPSDASFAIGIRFEDGFATDIDEVETDAEEVIYYDLNGLRVQEPVKGVVYIVNGKKVIF
ncbi:MAG: leucine-rich repeat protein, partial [Prevotella sp.]|nr:leucine-rich repeat protein [Prevotella sp.]